MIQINKGEIFYCGHFITNLKTPFVKLSKKPCYTKSPSETFFSKQLSYYSFKHRKNWYRLYRKTTNGFKFHSVYNTYTDVKKDLCKIVLDECLDNKENRWKIINYIQKIINVLIKSYPFTLLVTDFDINFDTGIEHIHGNWKVNDVFISDCSKELATIDPKYYSNIDVSTIKNHENILIIAKTNGYYSSYLTRYFYTKKHIKQVLPVTIFSI